MLEEMPRENGARKHVRVTMDAPNRDQGKRFLITEMSALQAERWFMRLVAYLARHGIEVSATARATGMASLINFNPLQLLAWVDQASLMDEVMSCIRCWPPDAPQPRPLSWSPTGPDIEEVVTLLQLKLEAITIHTGFSSAADLWKWALGWAVALKVLPLPTDDGSRPQTSPEESISSSVPN